MLLNPRITGLLRTPRLTLQSKSFRRTMSSFTLDERIFNPALYKEVTDFWLPGVNLDGKELDMDIVKRWFMADPEQRIAFDKECTQKFAAALDSISPQAFPAATADPFLAEIKSADKEQDGGAHAAWTALALTLLLDQMPRNIFRDNEGLRKVYSHYDKMSYSLTRTLLSPNPPVARVDMHPQWRISAAHRVWLYLPLMHSEEIEAHDHMTSIAKEFEEDLKKQERDCSASKLFLQKTLENEKEHRDILDKFGRYPHRNEALGRASTAEEEKFLEEGGAKFGVGEGKKKGGSASS